MAITVSTNYTIVKKSNLYNVLADLHMVKSTNQMIKEMINDEPRYIDVDVTNRVIKPLKGQAIKYANSHIKIDMVDTNRVEIWDGSRYIPPTSITWINDNNKYLYAILDKAYAEDASVKVFVNKNVISRFSDKTSTPKNFSLYLNKNDSKYSMISVLKEAIYAMVDGVLTKPVPVETSTALSYTIPYTSHIDVFICKNMVYNGKNTSYTTRVDSLTTKTIPGTFIINSDDSYANLDVKFYPYIKLDTLNNYIRIFKDKKIDVPYERIMADPKFSAITDPYSDTGYLQNITGSSTVITSMDTDNDILTKLADIAPEYTNYIGKLSSYGKASKIRTITLPLAEQILIKADLSYTYEYISAVQVDPVRDIMFYDGKVFDDFEEIRLKYTALNTYKIDTTAPMRYVIRKSKGYDLSKFTLLKFETKSNQQCVTFTKNLDGKKIYVTDEMKKNFDNLLVTAEVSAGNTNLYEIPIDENTEYATIDDVTDNLSVTVNAYSDPILNFRGCKAATKAQELFGDLVTKGIINLTPSSQTTEQYVHAIFSRRLMTLLDSGSFTIEKLRGRSTNYELATTYADGGQFSYVHSKGLMRYQFNASDFAPDISNHVISLSSKQIPFMKDRMVLFLNGKLIDPKNIDISTSPYIIRVNNFTEIISIVDIFVQVQDNHIIEIAKKLMSTYYSTDTSRTIDTSGHTAMVTINTDNQDSRRGVYDILFEEYLANDKMINDLIKIGDDPVALEAYKQSIIAKFPGISMKDMDSSISDADNKIAICFHNEGNAFYEY